jgi:hypothetical protein
LIDWYDGSGGREAMLRFGPAEGPVVVAALPLFEEANRTRTFTVALMRLLAERGIATALPDLPGTGESLVQVEETTLLRMREAMAAAVEHLGPRRTYALGIRSGALLDEDGPAYGRWHLAPQSGHELMRELERMANPSRAPDWWLLEEVTEIAGNRVSVDLLDALLTAKLHTNRLGVPLRTVRLESDPRPADRKVPGAPLWRRAEPDHDPALAVLLADDIAAWIAACEG